MSDAYDLEKTPQWKNNIIKHTVESPDDLLANPLNFRIHSKLQQDATVDSLDQLGWIKSVVANVNTGTIVDGHERVMLAMRKPGQKIPVEWVDLTPEQETVALMALDHIVGLAGIDAEKLNELATAVSFDDLGVDLRGMLETMVDEFSPINNVTGDMDLSKFSGVAGNGVAYRVVVDSLELSEAEKLSEQIDGSHVEQYRI